MKILMISTLNLTKSNGGTIHFTSIAQEFRKYGHSITAIIPDIGNNQSAHNLANLSFDKINFSGNNLSKFIPLSKTSINSFAQIFKVLTLNPSDYDWVYIRSNILSLAIILVLRIRGFKYIFAEHNGWFADELAMMGVPNIFIFSIKLLQVMDAHLATKVRAIVPGIKEKLVAQGVQEDKIIVVGNGTNIDLFQPINKQQKLNFLNLDKNCFYFGFIGDLEPWQGVETAIEAMAIICQHYPQSRLLVIGEGRLLETLKQKYGNHQYIQFIGAVPYLKSNDYINFFDIALLPKKGLSDIGYSPIKLYAYAAAGKPILASDIRGIQELASANFLVLHKPDDPQDLASKALNMMSNYNNLKEMGIRARQYAEAHFSWQLVSQKIVQAMQSFKSV